MRYSFEIFHPKSKAEFTGISPDTDQDLEKLVTEVTSCKWLLLETVEDEDDHILLSVDFLKECVTVIRPFFEKQENELSV